MRLDGPRPDVFRHHVREQGQHCLKGFGRRPRDDVGQGGIEVLEQGIVGVDVRIGVSFIILEVVALGR